MENTSGTPQGVPTGSGSQNTPEPTKAPSYEEKVSLIVRAIALKRQPDIASKVHISFDPALRGAWSVSRNGTGPEPHLRISLTPNEPSFLARLDAALHQARRLFESSPATTMLETERLAWSVLRSLGARQTVVYSQLALDIRPVRATSAKTAGVLFRAIREVAVEGGANCIHTREGVPDFVLSADKEALEAAEDLHASDVTLPHKEK